MSNKLVPFITPGSVSIQNGDDNSQLVDLNFDFPFYKTNYKQLTISTNGFVSFITNNEIRPYYADFITVLQGNVFYRSIDQSSVDLLTIQNEISQLLQTSFEAKNAFVITYDNVQLFSDRSDFANFQLILSTDSIQSYVTINYGSCLTSRYLPISEIVCLDNVYSIVRKTIVNPCESSNVNLTGKWIFNVTGDCK